MGTVHFTVGKNIGKIMLEISQEDIIHGNPKKAIDNYVQCFGIPKEYAIGILHNEYVLEAEDDGITVTLSNDENTIKENAKNIYNWNLIINNKYDSLINMRKSYYAICKEFHKHCNMPIYDANITEIVKRHFKDNFEGIGIHNIVAHLIAYNHLGKGLSNGSNIWDHLVNNVESENAHNYEYALYFIYQYVNLIKSLYKDYTEFINMYDWLFNNNFIKRISFIENAVENILDILNEFCNPNTGYYHPMCDEEIYNLKEQIIDNILHTEFGKEYMRNGIIKKNIEDHYDGGWLSPNGEFYGALGETSSMIHMHLADQMFNKLFDKNLLIKDKNKDGNFELINSMFNRIDPEEYLTKHGWMKIHHNEIYGTFFHDQDGEYPYCPTDMQIKEICKYIDLYYNGKFYTQPQIVKHTDPISTYKLRQMDKFMLNEIFRL